MPAMPARKVEESYAWLAAGCWLLAAGCWLGVGVAWLSSTSLAGIYSFSYHSRTGEKERERENTNPNKQQELKQVRSHFGLSCASELSLEHEPTGGHGVEPNMASRELLPLTDQALPEL